MMVSDNGKVIVEEHDRGNRRNRFIHLQSKPIDWFLYDRNLRHERVNDQ